MTGATEVRRILEATSLPMGLVDQLLDEAPALWLMSQSADMLASDLALCHPELGPGEVRALAVPMDYCGTWRLTVVAHDRPGLLADTAAVLAAEHLGVSSASALTWPDTGLALHSLTVQGDLPARQSWEALGARLRSADPDAAKAAGPGPGSAGPRSAGHGSAVGAADGEAPAWVPPPEPRFSPCGQAEVEVTGTPGGACLLTVSAADQTGLLWAICRGLADQGTSIEAARISSDGGRAQDFFVVDTAPDPVALAARLSRPVGDSVLDQMGHLADQLGDVAAKVPLVGPLAARALRLVPSQGRAKPG